jgi:hypothetical protein
MKKITKLLLSGLAVLSISGCDMLQLPSSPQEPTGSSTSTTDDAYRVYELACEAGFKGTYEDWVALTSNNNTSTPSINLEDINNYLHESEEFSDLRNYGNNVTILPYTHINGPRMEHDFFAFVLMEFDNMMYFKYQIAYLSCTDRTPEINYWQVAYVELTRPQSGNKEDIKIRNISFDVDGTGYYNAGFWGDNGTNNYPIYGTNITYEDINNTFIPRLEGKTYAQLFGVEDDNNVNEELLDGFGGATVSTQNIINVIKSLMEHHYNKNV